MSAINLGSPVNVNGMTRPEAARWYAEAGFPLFPVHSVRDGMCTCGKATCASPGKHPRTRRGFKDASKELAQVERWWQDAPDANIGVPTGAVSGLLVVDIDPRNGGDHSWNSLVEEHGPLPAAAEQVTGGGGRHIFFRDPGVAVPKELAPGIDLKAAGGYVVVAPSVHASGQRYAWDGAGGAEALLNVAAPPAWLLDALQSAREPSCASGPEIKWGQGQRNKQLTSIAGSMRRRGMSRGAIEAALLQENQEKCVPPLDDAEVSKIAQNVASYPPGGKNSGASVHDGLPGQTYQTRPEVMFRVTTKGEQQSEIQLSNFCASIVSSRVLDDGVETRRELEMKADLAGRSTVFAIPARTFAAMTWPIECIGVGAIVFPNQREYLRTAIQQTARGAIERTVYTHTGWRRVDREWMFLHAGGAIGAHGPVERIAVSLPSALRRVHFESASGSDDVRAAVRSSLKVLGPPEIAYPLRAATYRAALGEADFGVHLAGETGAFKSELAALEQQHFGLGLDSRHLPGSWSSTGNALEVLAFHSKDILFVIDDFAPQGSLADIGRYHAGADRVFRAAGNQAGRQRLDATARLRDQRPPRGLILSTGEEIPRGHSVRARLLILEISKGAIDPRELTTCQQAAAAGLYTKSMAAFLVWLAGRLDAVRNQLRQRVVELRGQACELGGHARTPEILANLQAGFEVFLEFAESCGALGGVERRQLAGDSWTALRSAGVSQSRYHAAMDPATRYLSLLSGALASGRVHLADRKGTVPDYAPEACGWRTDASGRFNSVGDRVGWIVGDDIYLEPSATYRAVQVAARESGEPLPVSDHTLRRRLREKGLLASSEPKRGTLTIRKTLSGSSQDVLHFRRATLLPKETDKPDKVDDDLDTVLESVADVGFSGRETEISDTESDNDSAKQDNDLQDDCRDRRVSSGEWGFEQIAAPVSMSGSPPNVSDRSGDPTTESDKTAKFEITEL